MSSSASPALNSQTDLVMMEMEQTAVSCPSPDQAAVRNRLSSITKGTTRTLSDTTSRFHGDGVRYKAKLIGVDLVPSADGDKMCWDSMMKLKGIEATTRKQGKHKQRVWLKVSSSGLKIIDERSGAVLFDHERSRISSLTKDESDPRALAYIYPQQDTYSLFYIKMANLADPVLDDIKEVCQRETAEDATETPTQNNALLLLDESAAPSPEVLAYEHVFSPQTNPSFTQTKQSSPSNELMEVFSIQVMDPQMLPQSVCTSQPESPQPQLPQLSNSQILSMFPTQPVARSPYSSPTYSPTAMPWVQQGLPGTQFPGPMGAAPWPTMSAWAAVGAPPPAGSQIQAQHSQPGHMIVGNTINSPAVPTAVSRYPTPLNSPYNPPGATATLQPMSPSMDNPLL
ncbi:hypothetical protein PAMA_001220 [Pampus argenteus]